MGFHFAQDVSKTLRSGTTSILRAISLILPRHIRRLVLWSTLYSKMCGGQKFTKEQSVQLNNALTLCKDCKAFDLPAILGKFIWQDLDGCAIAARKAIRGEETAENAAQDFLHSIPSWLRYASDSFVLKDFQSMLATHRQTLVAAA